VHVNIVSLLTYLLTQLHSTLSNENVKWYFRDTSYNSWPIVWRHPQRLCLWSRRGFASPQSALSSSTYIAYAVHVVFFTAAICAAFAVTYLLSAVVDCGQYKQLFNFSQNPRPEVVFLLAYIWNFSRRVWSINQKVFRFAFLWELFLSVYG